MTRTVVIKAAEPGVPHEVDIMLVDMDGIATEPGRHDDDAAALWDILKGNLPHKTFSALMQLIEKRLRAEGKDWLAKAADTLSIKEGDVVTLSGARVPAAAVAKMQDTLSRAMGFDVPVLVVPDGKLGKVSGGTHTVCGDEVPVVTVDADTLSGDMLDSWVVAGRSDRVPAGKKKDWVLLQDPSRWPLGECCCVKHTWDAVPNPARAVDFAGTVTPAEEIDAGPPRCGTVWLRWSFAGGQFRISKKEWNHRVPPSKELDTYPHWCYTSVAEALADGWMVD